MKKKFLNSSIALIKKYKRYSDEEFEIIEYGLEGIYLTFSKMIVIFLIAFLLDIFKETLFLLITYNIIRIQAFGIHASKSIYCLIVSLLMLIGGTLICKYVVFNKLFLILGTVICNICLLLYAPADTHKRPLINDKKRKKFKYVSFSLGLIYTFLIILFSDYSFVNYLFVGMVEAVIMILPITYKIFKMPYNNYKTYNYGV